jgi:thiol-disulfide isomerase/thioredoxin
MVNSKIINVYRAIINIYVVKYFISIVFLHIAVLTAAFSNSGYTLSVRLSKLPDSKIFLASVRGDAYKIIDTAELRNSVCKFLLSDNAQPGIYRIIPETAPGQGRHNGPVNTIDVIFNRENISIKTVYPWLQDSITVLESNENMAYFGYMKQQNLNQNKLDILRNLLTQYPADDELYVAVVKRYNDLQREQQRFILQTCERHKGTFAASLIAMNKTPFLDANLTETERQAYYKKHYFDELNFSNRDLINSGAYTHSVVRYIMLYRDPALPQAELEKEFMKAVDIVLSNANKDAEVYDFVINYLMEGFERLKLDNVLKYISDNYLNTVCKTSDNSTLLRRMESCSKLAVGMQAPDIATRNPQNQEIRLSAVDKPYTLVVFWASWCPGCEELLPKLKNWYMSKTIDIEILAISIDSVRADWNEAIEKNGYNFTHGCDLKGWNGKAASDYFVYATPTLFLLDKNRKILAKPISFEDLSKAVEGLPKKTE